MSTKEEMERAYELLGNCIASLNSGCNIEKCELLTLMLKQQCERYLKAYERREQRDQEQK